MIPAKEQGDRKQTYSLPLYDRGENETATDKTSKEKEIKQFKPVKGARTSLLTPFPWKNL